MRMGAASVRSRRMVLEEYRTDLHAEILDTEDRDFKRDLKSKEEAIKHILEKLEFERTAQIS